MNETIPSRPQLALEARQLMMAPGALVFVGGGDERQGFDARAGLEAGADLRGDAAHTGRVGKHGGGAVEAETRA